MRKRKSLNYHLVTPKANLLPLGYNILYNFSAVFKLVVRSQGKQFIIDSAQRYEFTDKQNDVNMSKKSSQWTDYN